MNVHSWFYFRFRHWYPRVINASRSFLSELPLMALSVHTSTFLSKLSLVVPSVVTRFHTNLIIFEQINGHTIWIHSLDFGFQCLGGGGRLTLTSEFILLFPCWSVLPYDCPCNRALIKLVTFDSVKTHQHMWLHVYQICKFVSVFVSLKRWSGRRSAYT